MNACRCGHINHGDPIGAGDSDDKALGEFFMNVASETVYRFLSAVLADPRSPAWSAAMSAGNKSLFREAVECLREEFRDKAASLGFGESPPGELDADRLLAALDLSPDQMAAEHVRVFGLSMCRECPPYETEYLPNEDTFFRAQQIADVAGFYQAFGLAPNGEYRERPDCLRLELEFAALLLMKERLAPTADEAAVCRSARASFVRDHLSWWVPSFAMALRRKAGGGPYAALGEFLAAWSPIDRIRVGAPAPLSPLEARCLDQDDCTTCLAGGRVS